MKTFSLLFAWLLVGAFAGAPLFASQTGIAGPSGSGSFGKTVKILFNGNFIVIDPDFDDGAVADVGAVYLYTSAGTVISTLKGSHANDHIGSGGLVDFPFGNVVVISPLWDNGGTADAGAVTFINGGTGLNGTVSSSNSLVGSSAGDMVGSNSVQTVGIFNYAVKSPKWHNGAVVNAGAVTIGSLFTGFSGTVSASNSLVGSTTDDKVGSGSLMAISGTTLVVATPTWDNGAIADAGALTVVSLFSANGAVSTSNSLVGSHVGDRVGSSLVASASAVIAVSPDWDNGAVADAGAVTRIAGTTSGVLSSSNSLVGSTAGDHVGSGGVVELFSAMGYVVLSPAWHNGATVDAGAATFCSPNVGGITTGTVSTLHSLYGTQAGDKVGSSSILPLANGNAVVFSPNWTNGALAKAGAATFINPGTFSGAAVSTANSLYGGHAQDQVGTAGERLSNGHYVVRSLNCDNGVIDNAGAVTWCNGTTGLVGEVSIKNSLMGTSTDDFVGFFVKPLTNGNYVVFDPFWDNNGLVDAGTAIWCNGTTGMKGVISAANALVGSHAGDFVGNDVFALSNGNYVTNTPYWDGGKAAITFGNGTTGITGSVSASNSLVGSTGADGTFGVFVYELPGGNYVVTLPTWSGAGVTFSGAAAWCSGVSGKTGVISSANALISNAPSSFIGYPGLGEDAVRPLFTGTDHYAVLSRGWDSQHGAVTFSTSATGITGAVSASNSILGTAASGGPNISLDVSSTALYTAVGFGADNKVTLRNEQGKVRFTTSEQFMSENTTGNQVFVERIGGSEGTITVNVTSTSVGGTGTAGADYTPVSQLLTFNPGEVSKTVLVDTLSGNATNEANETFKLVLSGGTAVLGDKPSCLVRIVEPGDTILPPAPVILTPVANAHLGVNPGGKLTITGTAKDNKGIYSVSVELNGTVIPTTITSTTGTSVTWSAVGTPVTGLNTISATCYDTANAGATILTPSPTATRSFFVSRPLIVKSLGGTATLTSGFSPTSFRDVGKLCTVTATPAAGFIFANWSLSGGASASDIGVTADQLELPTLTFIYKEGVQLTANVVPSPYVADTVAGTYNGSVIADQVLPDRAPVGSFGPEDGTLPGNSTEGFFTTKVMTNGSFTGSLILDGKSTPVVGAFDHLGDARFGPSRSRTFTIARPGKTSLAIALQMTVAALASSINGTVTDLGTNTPTAVSNVTCGFAYYNGTTRKPVSYLGTNSANGIFTAVFGHMLAGGQPSGTTAEDYPQGDGYATITVTKTGAVTLSGVLADDTPVSASGTLSNGDVWQFFASLYNKQGYLRSDVIFDHTQANTDLSSTTTRWVRPLMDNQYYSKGWPGHINLNLMGARFAVPTGASILPALPAIDGDGNADVTFSDGALPVIVTKHLSITPADVVSQIAPVDSKFKLTITRSSGLFSGTFTHANGTNPSFKGIVLQKGIFHQGMGFFKTVAPAVKDYTGQVGAVLLAPQ